LLQQRLRLRLQLWPERQRTCEIGVGQRMLLDADEVQARPGWRDLIEQLPGAEEVEPGAEAGFADHQVLPGGECGEAPGEVVLGEKHVTGFFQPRGARKVHVAIVARLGLAARIPVEFGGLEGGRCGAIWHGKIRLG